MKDLPDTLELLSARVDALEKRVCELEHPQQNIVTPAVGTNILRNKSQEGDDSGTEAAGSIFPVLGKAMLGFAGAFLLRALAEASVIPRGIIAAIAIAYAVAWLGWSARLSNAASFVRATYACTSALILAPMVWELTLHFKVLPPALTAGLLGGFGLVATALTWKRDLPEIRGSVLVTAAVAAIALAIATREIVPFVAALLLMAALVEMHATQKHGRAIWMLVILVANLGAAGLIFIYSGPASARTDYPAVGLAALLLPACLLFVIQSAGIVIRTLQLDLRVTTAEVALAIISFALAATSVVLFAPQSGLVLFGGASIVLSVVSYFVGFVHLRARTERRNANVFVVWSAALFVIGVLFSLPGLWAGTVLDLAAIAASVAGMRLDSAMLKFHAAAYLVVAAIVCGIPQCDYGALAGTPPISVGWGVIVFGAAALVCYWIDDEHAGEGWQRKVVHLVTAILAILMVASLATEGLLRLAALVVNPDVGHVALIRTFTICAIALALAFGGSRLQQPAMKRLAYAALLFEAVKLVFEDLHHGRMEFIAASFFMFAMTLIAVPRLSRVRPKPAANDLKRTTDQTPAQVR
jgi:hypothetical protein